MEEEQKQDTFRKEYRELTDQEKAAMENIKNKAEELQIAITGWVDCQPHPSDRAIAVAKTKLEECVMWAIKGVTG